MTNQKSNRFDGRSGQEKILRVLLGNELVGGNQRIADLVIGKASQVVFSSDEKIIVEGGQDDDVFFLISGKVKISIRGKSKEPVRQAPLQVGEMSALNPEDRRSATVTALNEGVVALKLSAADFREIGSDFPEFLQRAGFDENKRNKAWRSPGTEQKWFENFLTAKTGAVVMAFLTSAILAVYVALWSSILTGFLVLFLLTALIFLAMVLINRTRTLTGCCIAVASVAVTYLTNPITFTAAYEEGQFSGSVRSTSDVNLFIASFLILLVFIIGRFAHKSFELDKRISK